MVGSTSGVSPVPLPPEAVASVNGELILRADYDRALAAVGELRREPLSPAVRQRILDRLIDEELLVQHGLSTRTAQRAPRVRAVLSSTVIDSLVERGELQGPEPSEDELRALYRKEPHLFSAPVRLGVAGVFFAGPEGLARARAFEPGSEGESGDPWPVPLPEGPVPLTQLRVLLGGEAAERIGTLAAGQWTEAVALWGGGARLQLVERSGGRSLPFEEVRPEIRVRWYQRRGDQRLREFLEAQRRGATIRVAGSEP